VHDPAASSEALLTEPVNNYRRWVNGPWPVVELAGQNKAGEWTETKENRLQSLVSRAHMLGYWIRFYTLDGGSDEHFKKMGWFTGYNFGSQDAAMKRWNAAVRDGVDFIASDHYEDVAQTIKSEQKSASNQKPANATNGAQDRQQ
jgi:hypothetical protein